MKTKAQLDADIAVALAKKRAPKGAPTDTNLFALTELVLRHGGRSHFSNRVDGVDAPHIKRCLAAGLLEVIGRELVLTPRGTEIVSRRLQTTLKQTAQGIDIAVTRGYQNDEKRDRARCAAIETAIATLANGE